MPDQARLDEQCINTIRFLAVDAVEKAHSGHPGAPMGMAAMAYVLWDRFLKHDPNEPDWPDRDRFVLSAGHASMLLYALLHLTGYDLPLEEIEAFRQWGSATPGHPERGDTPGVEVTTGPLGQGFSNAVGMAVAERWLAERYNRPGHDVVDHHTYALASDGDLQEGVASEAASLAGTLGLGKLVVLYDDNDIQIEGPTDLTFTEDVAGRFAAYGWHVVGPVDGLDLAGIEAALDAARAEAERPSLVIVRTVIGHGSPRQGTAKVHGEPLGAENARAAKATLGWPEAPAFLVPDEVRAHMGRARERGAADHRAWDERLAAYAEEHPVLATRLEAELAGELPAGWDGGLDGLFPPGSEPVATRNASGAALNALAGPVGNLVGGSADLAPSNKTILADFGDLFAEAGGRNMRFGVREHGMGSILNGMALHGGLIPYGGTFLVFSDYMRPPMRLAALMGLRVIYVFTHDSIGLGEDGPTHQPIEHVMGLRTVPKLHVIRPADAGETVAAWRAALARANGPTALVLTRQKLPVLDHEALGSTEGPARGGYVLWDSGAGTPDLILIATGSEVQLALAAGRRLADEGTGVRVVSVPCWEMFDAQPAEYRAEVLPPTVTARVAVEAGVRLGWERYVGHAGAVVGLDRFGASAPAPVLFEKLGFTVERVVGTARAVLAGTLGVASGATLTLELGEHAAAVTAAEAALAADRVLERIRNHDHTVWDPDPTEITNRLGWLHSPAIMPGQLGRARELAAAVLGDGYTHALLLGMGGSSLAPEVFGRVFGADGDGLILEVLDSTEPAAVRATAARLDTARTLVVVATKSGGTVETLSLFKAFFNKTVEAVGAEGAGAHFVAITDPGSRLVELAAHHGFRATFVNDPNIGGRYSALSWFGLLPAALAGIDLDTLLDRARAAADAGAGIRLGATIGALAGRGRDKLTVVASPELATFGAWVEQLVAESTGKDGTGVLPVDLEPPAAAEAYGADRLFVHLRLDGDDTGDAHVAALAAAGQPVVRLALRDRYDLGGEIFRWELATAVASHVLGIQPFDQPNVESAKVLARRMVSAYSESGALPAPEPALTDGGVEVYTDAEVSDLPGALAAFLDTAEAGGYIALQAYLPPDDETWAALQAWRSRLLARTGLATTLGYGPRFLHSTGQLHKGDGGNGLFVQITADHPADEPIPDEAGAPASSMTFGTLIDAQALGDRQALLDAGRRVIRFHLGSDIPGGLGRLLDATA